ncbi:VCBS repeat-containing protein [Streptomyces sp. SID8373]|uniref:FG-GAP repeat domain-containing protein n=1 Tax=Streptomyces sp. SID8373 TaxID=2690353 RepID=UPI00048EB9C4|nr:VCBS repeat-containing protein [Streptomyces sp. SID8373]MYX69506.1 hypothetical protein [Streptomyces sp. SID8373]
MRFSRSTVIRCVTVLVAGGLSAVALTPVPAEAASSQGGTITRSEIIARAQTWVDQKVPYSQSATHNDPQGTPYREDCSGYISMAWHTSAHGMTALTTETLPNVSTAISRSSAQAGDALNNRANGHAVLFGGWQDKSANTFTYYAESNPNVPTDKYTGDFDASTLAGWPTGNYQALKYDKTVDDVTLHFSQTTSADFNGDRQADIIARDSAGNLKMWTHNPGGYFNAAKQVTAGWNFTQTAAADFTGDGKADIVARDGAGNLKMWAGHGDGSFGAARQVTAGWDFTQTAVADFDGNGKADIIARDGSGNLKIWAGHGDGTFGAAAQLSAGWNFTQTSAADFNGDRQADIIARDSAGNLKMWTHNPGGYFNAAKQVTAGWNFSQTSVADYDGNGKADIIARDDSTGKLYIWAGHGDTTFGARTELTSGW